MTETTDRARTPLLTLITQEALDRDYQVAASRRGDDDREGIGLRVAVVFVVAVFAMLVTVAAVQTSQDADVNNASRASLIDRAESRSDAVAALQSKIADLRAANSEADISLRSLGTRFADAQARRSESGALTGFEAVTGDGVRITLDDPEIITEDTEFVRDSDIALLANALWAAGAEAISINGQRLTAVSGIRTSGEAIEIAGIGIAPPYTIRAIGNRQTLAANFVENNNGLQFISLADEYLFRFDMDNEDDLHLPAAPASLRELRSAKFADSPKEQGGDAP